MKVKTINRNKEEFTKKRVGDVNQVCSTPILPHDGETTISSPSPARP